VSSKLLFVIRYSSLVIGHSSFTRISGFCLLFAIFFFCSCKNKRSDISSIKVDLKVERFEKELFSLNTENHDNAIDDLISKYDDFFFFYFNEYARAWQMRNDSTQAWKDSVAAYVADPVLHALYDSVEQKFSDLTPIEKNLSASLRYFKYYFPGITVPEVITLINGPGHGAFTYGDSILCIALDDYMGPNFSYYKFQNIPHYLLRRFSSEYIVPNCMQVIITHQFQFDPSRKKLLDAMIYNGKVLYLRSQMMPDSPDSLITAFAEKDLIWCKNNEPEIWKFFITKNLLYSTDPLEYLKYVNEGPSTSGMPPEAPGNAGSWVGWRIVSKYMKQNPKVTLKQLMNEQNAQLILTESKYKP
jgi:gliding motility-associated lipoprotein GldB